jgi:large conductance mechanosensitive channel
MGMLKEFKEFAMKGNIVDLAIAVILGGAFGKVVTALTASLIMPIIALILGKGGVTDMSVMVGNTVFPIGLFLQAVIDFILVAFVLFLIIKAINSRKRKVEEAPAAPSEEVVLLREIRDSLRK